MPDNKKKKRQIRFLQDKPADQDFFGTHKDLAIAVATALASNPELRTVGLLGKWGSGKSTVLREVQKCIDTTSSLSDIRVFTFDAWEHQGESIRRSFLESLFSFLTESELIKAKDWQGDIDLLSGRLGVTENIETPQLTPPAKQLLWSLTLVPFGLSLFGLDTLKEGLGETTSTAGKLALWLAILCFVVPLIFIGENLFGARSAEESRGDDEVIGLIINKKVNRVKTRTIKSPDPTAIDFGRTCDGLIAEVAQKKHRLLCIVDNLDRLPTRDALEMWSAIRAIFANIKLDGLPKSHPFVLVPMDHSALLASFGGADGNEERASSFIDKTFDLTFRVPPPVRSDWKAFLRSQMKAVFGNEAIEDRTMYFVEKVFDAKHQTETDFPTPRLINRFVNSVAATWLARQADDFPLAIVSLFVANLEAVEASVLQFTQREDMRFFDGDFPDWRDQIAALYFGVPEAKSRQVLLERPIRKAIEDADLSQFRSLMKYPGAFKVFDDTLRAYAYEPTSADSQTFAFKVARLLEAVEGEDEAVRRSKDYVLDKIVESAAAPELAELDENLRTLTDNLSRRQIAKLVPAVTRWLSVLASTADDADDFNLIARLYQRLNEFKSLVPIPKIVLSGEPAAVINSIYWINGNSLLEAATSVETPFSELTPELTKLVGDEDQAFIVPEVLSFRARYPAAFPKENTVAIAPLRAASISILTAGGATGLTRYAAQSVGIMTTMTKQSEEEVDGMIDQGHLQNRLNDAISSNDQDTVGVLAALAIARGKAFNAEAGPVGDPTRLHSMETALEQFDGSALNALWNAQAAGYSPAFLERSLHHVVRNRELSKADLDQIANNLEFYFKPLTRAERHMLGKKIGEDPSRVEKIGRLSPSSMLVDILTPLLRSGVGDAEKQCRDIVENLPADSWKSFVLGSAGWVFDLLEKCPGDFKLTVNSNAVEATVGLIEERSGALTVSERAKLRRLASHFNIHAERKLIDAIIGLSSPHTRNALALAKTLKDEMSSAISSNITADRFVALVSGFSLLSDGREWLETQLQPLQKAVDRFDKASKNVVLDWFNTAKAQKPKVRANWIELTSNRLQFGR